MEQVVQTLMVILAVLAEYGILRGVERLLRQHRWRYVVVVIVGIMTSVLLAPVAALPTESDVAFLAALVLCMLLVVFVTLKGSITMRLEEVANARGRDS